MTDIWRCSALQYKSNSAAVKFALKMAKHELCAGVGVLAVGEVQSVTPVLTSNLKKSIASDVMPKDEGVYIGVTQEAKYGIYVEKGTSKQKAQPFLEPGAMNAIPKITSVAEKIYKSMMGGA